MALGDLYTEDQRPGHYILERVKKLPPRGDVNKLYFLVSEAFTKLYRYNSDGTKEVIVISEGSTFVEEGLNVEVTGNGTQAFPYIINAPTPLAEDILITGFTATDLQGSLEELLQSQNNVFIEKQYNGESGILFEKVSDSVNNDNPFTIAATELYAVSNAYIVYPNSDEFYFKTDYYLFKKGKGIYGLGQTLTIEEDFFFIRTNEGKSFQQVGNLTPQVETIVYTDITNPIEAVNTSVETYSIQLNRDTFFIIKSTSQTVPVPNIIYRFIGSVGTYGFGGNLTIEEDFLLIEDQSQTNTTNTTNAVSGYKGYFESLESISNAIPNPNDAWHAYRLDGNVRYYALNGSWREELLTLNDYATITDIEIGNQLLIFENNLI
jgi:hypothetical protein